MTWATLGVVPQYAGVWPDVEVTQSYRGRELLLRPEGEKNAATVSTHYSTPATLDESLGALRRFLSAATWGSNCRLEECMALGGSSPGGAGRLRELWPYNPPRHPKTSGFSYVPEPDGERALLALALFREGLNERNPFYKFLGFFKIVETVASGREALKRKIAAHIKEARLRAAGGLERAHYLNQIGQEDLAALIWADERDELPAFLYEQGRCAIAHAHSQPLRDPDHPADRTQIQLLLPLIEALGRVVIEREHGVSRWGPTQNASPA